MFSNEELAELLFERRLVADILPAIYDGLSIVEAPQELPNVAEADINEIADTDADTDTYYCRRVSL